MLVEITAIIIQGSVGAQIVRGANANLFEREKEMKTREMLLILVLVLGLVGSASAALVAHYEFEGNANDSSANALHGTAHGGPSYVGGMFGQAIGLDGVDDYVDCGNSPLLDITGQITVAAWVRTNDSANGEHNPYITKGDHSFALKHGFNGIQFFIYDGDYRAVHVPVDSSFNGIWHHVAGTYDGSEVKLYIDGALEASLAYTGSIASSTHSVNIGSNAEVSGRFYDGAIDDVRIYDNALTAGQVLQLYEWRPPEDVKGFTYQGRLLDNNVAADGLYDVEFKLFDDTATGTQVGNTITVHDIDVIEGYFTVALDFGNDIFNGDDRWLQISVRPGNSTGSFTILSPRQKITPTPYAIYAERAGEAIGGGGGADNDWRVSGGDMYSIPSGNIGIGTSNPDRALHIQNSRGSIRIDRDENCASVYMVRTAPDDFGNVWKSFGIGTSAGGQGSGHFFIADLGTATGGGGTERIHIDNNGNVGIGTTSPDSKLEVHGTIHGEHETNGGVLGVSLSGYGVGGSSSSGHALLGSSSTGDGVHAVSKYGYGGYFEGPKNYFEGNVGIGTTSPGYKLTVSTSEPTGRAVFGKAMATGNVKNYGGYFEARGTYGHGVYGYATGNNGYGVRGYASNTGNYMNYGGCFEARGRDGRGVAGLATGNNGEGVYGYASATGNVANYGGYFRADGGPGRGVYGEASGINGIGVYGYAGNSGDYWNYGGWFEANGKYGRGVYGYATGSEGWGVFGKATGSSAVGVCGKADGNYGTGVEGWGEMTDFYASGPGINYFPFTGSHEVKLCDHFPVDVEPGMIVCVTGQTGVRHDEDGTVSISSTLPTVKLSDVANDKAVFGVLVKEAPLHKEHWHEATETERFAAVNALGEGRVWVCNINGQIEAGDYITTSSIPGYGQRQDDDLLHSYTLGKAIETIDWDSVTEIIEFNGQTYKVYLIAAVYTSG